jgi:exodeoxyribonuclease VII large subunit
MTSASATTEHSIRGQIGQPAACMIESKGVPGAWPRCCWPPADALAARLGAVTVRGEISGFTRAASGHCYFSLKDSDGQQALLRCAMFRRAAGLLDFRPADGQQVELRGRITVYESRGELQCVVEHPAAPGRRLAVRSCSSLKARLAAAGLFDAQRKRPLPAHPRTVGVVTSLGAAALHDVLTAIAAGARRRCRWWSTRAWCRGPRHRRRSCGAIDQANARQEVDTCCWSAAVAARWKTCGPSTTRRVVRAVAGSALPVVCGVGHETDTCLAELAADLRAPTPTAAAELAVPLRSDALARLQALALALQRAVGRRLDQQAQRLDRLALQIGRPARLLDQQAARLDRLRARQQQALVQALAQRQRRLDDLAQRLRAALRQQVHGQGEQLARLALRLAANDPQQVLSRGYAWLADGEGRPVTRAAGLAVGSTLAAQWADGRAAVQVLSVQVPGDAAAAPPKPRAARKRKPSP